MIATPFFQNLHENYTPAVWRGFLAASPPKTNRKPALGRGHREV
jgi:hypothetical protein